MAGRSSIIRARRIAAIERLNEYGLVFRPVEGPVGAASALKMSYGGITKGLTAVGSAMILAAERAGVAEALHAELAASQPNLLAYFTRSVPDMFGKAYRWVPEMEEIAHFSGDPASRKCTRRSPPCTEQLAADNEGEKARYRGAGGVFRQSTKRIESFRIVSAKAGTQNLDAALDSRSRGNERRRGAACEHPLRLPHGSGYSRPVAKEIDPCEAQWAARACCCDGSAKSWRSRSARRTGSTRSSS